MAKVVLQNCGIKMICINKLFGAIGYHVDKVEMIPYLN